MALSNAEIVRNGIEAWNRGDADATLAGLQPDIEWTTNLIDAAETFHGHEGVRRFWATFWEAWERITIKIDQLLEVDDTVLVFGHFRALGRDSGIELESGFGQVYRLRDGEVVRFEAYPNPAAALEAAGLDPAAAMHRSGS
jgi:ketosteroid isomerase-like protein